MREVSLDQLQQRPQQVLDWLKDSDEAVAIELDGHTQAVLQRVDTFERQRQALLMMQLLLNGEQDIAEDRLIPHEQLMGTLEALLKA